MQDQEVTQNENISPFWSFVPLNVLRDQSQTNSQACCCVGLAIEDSEMPRKNHLEGSLTDCHSNKPGSLLNKKFFSSSFPLKKIEN